MKLLSTFAAFAVLSISSGCGGNSASPALVPDASRAVRPDARAVRPDTFRRGIYVSTTDGIFGYRTGASHQKPGCVVHGAVGGGAIAVDGARDLIVPGGGSRLVTIFRDPQMCGYELGSFSDPYGQPSDAASANAASGPIAVANIFDTSGAGSIAVCTLTGGCTANLTNANMYEVAGVAMARNGDCWASATNSLGTATLTYFKRCAGAGKAATGFENTYYGGLDIDDAGNLVAVSAFDAKLSVYKGCNPACTLVGGPFALKGDSVWGHLDQRSKHFAAADYSLNSVDVYAYASTSLTLEYSISLGFSPSNVVGGVAYQPRSKE
jgi:hypothetical protein